MLRALSGDVREVDADFSVPEDDPDFDDDSLDESEYRNPIIQLASIRNTLTSLSGEWFETDEDVDRYKDIVYPNLREFRVQEAAEILNVAPYLHAFPNLAILHVHTMASTPMVGSQGEWRHWRTHNKDSQELHGSWRGLARYSGSLVDLWALGLTCRVDHVVLEGPSRRRDTAKFPEVIADVRPKRLTIHIDGSTLCDPIFLSAIRSKAASELRGLELKIDFDNAERDMDMRQWLKSLVELAAAVPLTTFALSIRCLVQPRDNPVKIFLDHLWDVEDFADHLQTEIPSLKSLYVTLLRKGSRVAVKRGPDFSLSDVEGPTI